MPTMPADANTLHVAVGVIRNTEGEVLIARRHDHLHQGGLWEFPGGKVEAEETVLQALGRELHEELDIRVTDALPLIQVRHAYPDRAVLLDTWEVLAFSGTPRGREAQPLRWVPAEQLPQFAFPAANGPIVTAVRLPERYGILDDPQPTVEWLVARLRRLSACGVRLVQLRVKCLSLTDFRALAAVAVDTCRSLGLILLLNTEPALARDLGAHGVHLSAARLNALRARPLGQGFWVAASCHSHAELAKAEAIGVDFAVLSPVLATPSHPGATPLGWRLFRDMLARVKLPVYALGGMNLDCSGLARQNGARGIAGIRGITPTLDDSP